jgi:hypothetical protein
LGGRGLRTSSEAMLAVGEEQGASECYSMGAFSRSLMEGNHHIFNTRARR